MVIGVDSAGNFIGFLLDKDKTVFTYDHDFGGYYKIADNFEQYIEKSLNMELNISF